MMPANIESQETDIQPHVLVGDLDHLITLETPSSVLLLDSGPGCLSLIKQAFLLSHSSTLIALFYGGDSNLKSRLLV